MFVKKSLGILRGSRAVRAGAIAALIAASIATGAGPVGASIANSVKITGGNVDWATLIERMQASAEAAMRQAGVGPSLAGSSTPTGH